MVDETTNWSQKWNHNINTHLFHVELISNRCIVVWIRRGQRKEIREGVYSRWKKKQHAACIQLASSPARGLAMWARWWLNSAWPGRNARFKRSYGCRLGGALSFVRVNFLMWLRQSNNQKHPTRVWLGLIQATKHILNCRHILLHILLELRITPEWRK